MKSAALSLLLLVSSYGCSHGTPDSTACWSTDRRWIAVEQSCTANAKCYLTPDDMWYINDAHRRCGPEGR